MGATDRAAGERRQQRPLVHAFGISLPARTKTNTVLSYGCSLAAVGVLTWLGFRLHFEAASIAFLFLIVVVVSAAYGDFWQATVTSIASVACVDYFFIPPLFTFNIADPRDWLALGTFEFTALMLSHLSRRAQTRAAQAIMERQNSDRLYETAQRILRLDRSRDPRQIIPSLIREIFGFSTVALFDAESTGTEVSGQPSPKAEELARSAYYRDREEFDSDTATWSGPLRAPGRPTGGLALSGPALTPLIGTALASLSAIALERARSFETESRAEAAHQIEQLRSAVLDALAHEIMTPLTVIRTASSGLLAAGGLGDPQTELVTLIDDQSKELNQLTSRLLGAARLDGADFKPRSQSFLFSSLAQSAVENFPDSECQSRFKLVIPDDEPSVWADPGLIETALAQLLDNAVKYSDPGSTISIEVTSGKTDVVVTVRDRGLIISPADRERIFERFYRGKGSQSRSAGTGLGLSIVRRIVDAHQGRVWAESDSENGTSFALALPRASSQP